MFTLSELANDDPKRLMHQVRIYRFWAYDPANHVPVESNYFLKMIQIINYNNPVCVGGGGRRSEKVSSYPREDYSDAVASYIIHAE
jgi:hypothetical protein